MAIDTVFLLFLLDQISKYLILDAIQLRQFLAQDLTATPPLAPSFIDWITALSLPRLDFISIPVTSFFNIVMVWNEGISFGLMSGTAGSGNMMLMFGLSAVILGFGVWMLRTSDHVIRFILAVIIGGALGNLWDRVRFGGVADFFDFYLGNWHYPAFNVADACIVVGILALMGYELFCRPRDTDIKES